MGKGFAGVLRIGQTCAKATRNRAWTPFQFGCLSSPTPKARGSNPPGRTKGSTHLGATFFILYEILREAERGFEQLQRRPPPAAEAGSRSRGRGRRGQAPPKGRRPMRAPQPVQCPPPASRRAKKPLRGFFRARRAQYPLWPHKTRTPLHHAEACGSHRIKKGLLHLTAARSRRCTARWCGRR